MREKIRHKGKIFKYVISRGLARIYQRGKKRIIVDMKGNIRLLY